MLENIFVRFVNMSLTAGWLVLAVIVLRLIFRKAPKWIFCILWGLVALRLVLPVSFESRLSLIPSTEVLPADITTTAHPRIHSGIAVIDDFINRLLSPSKYASQAEDISNKQRLNNIEKNSANDAANDNLINPAISQITDNNGIYPDSVGNYGSYANDTGKIASESTYGKLEGKTADSVNPTQVLSFILSRLWLAGVIGMLLYAAISYVLLRRKVMTAVRHVDNIYFSEFVSSPFLLGIIRPRIYLPYKIDENERAFVIAHEKAHIARRDHWWKPLGFILLAVYWFNPLIWAAYILLCRDIEAACDEKVVSEMDTEERRSYSNALLNASLGLKRRRIAACPLAFGETGVKNRIKNVMNYRKPVFWIIVAAIVGCIVLAVCFLTDPAQKKSSASDGSGQEQAQNTETGSIRDIVGEKEEQNISTIKKENMFSEKLSRDMRESWNNNSIDEASGIKSLSGHLQKTFSTWKETVEYLGVEPWNILEDADWIEKKDLVTSKDNGPGSLQTHCMLDSYGTAEGELTYISLKSGYTYDETDIIMNIKILDIFSENETESESESQITPELKRDNDAYGYTREYESYFEDEIKFKHDGYEYVLQIRKSKGSDANTESIDKARNKICLYLKLNILGYHNTVDVLPDYGVIDESAGISRSESILSDNIYNAIQEDWDRWDERDEFSKMISSSLPGAGSKYFETWQEAVDFIGVEPWNPLEDADWLKIMNYTGADIKDMFDPEMLPHCSLTWYGTRDNKLTYAEFTTGYAVDEVRVTLKIDLHNASEDVNLQSGNLQSENPQTGELLPGDDQNINSRPLGIRLSETYHERATAKQAEFRHVNKDGYYFYYTLRCVNLKTGGDALAKATEVMNRVLEYMGMGGIPTTPVNMMGPEPIPGTDANSETDYFIDFGNDSESGELNIQYINGAQ